MASEYADHICIEGMFTSTIDWILYSSILCYFICKAGKNKFGTATILMLLVPLIQYLLCSLGRITDWFRYPPGEAERCHVYFFRSWYDWVEEIATVATGLIINIFMLRNMKVAAVLRAESVEQEQDIRRKIHRFTIIYLPLYFVL